MYTYLNTALAVLRLIIFAQFFVATKSKRTDYYYIWLPAIATWAQDGFTLYYYYYVNPDDKEKDQMMPYQTKELLYIKILLLFFAIWKYALYAPFAQAVQAKNFPWRVITFFVCIYSIGVLKFSFDIRGSPFDHFPFPWLNFSMFNRILDCMLFVHAMYSVSTPDGIKNNPSFLMFGCLITLLPLNSSLQALVLLLPKPLISTAWMASLICILSFALSYEGALVRQMIVEARQDKFEWPEVSHDHVEDKKDHNFV
ncbi:hypothetical protein BDB00DRAFT_817839 [Zychaea mexicana]|uniref:uncharacterized protein n=1 Tax=Zychaea mexicana TaxID=64656 RepID=UPI0022FE098B|nr:uncharacterized protein BDB00DRAFT_817839 [Zychaea mexicana]KAI9494684.1 hypothetical protein BDB00DRAFT_817839 [Zychaea mexicana]